MPLAKERGARGRKAIRQEGFSLLLSRWGDSRLNRQRYQRSQHSDARICCENELSRWGDIASRWGDSSEGLGGSFRCPLFLEKDDASAGFPAHHFRREKRLASGRFRLFGLDRA